MRKLFSFGIVKKKGLREMNTHNDFLNNAVDDELETEGIENLTIDVCSDMHNDTEKCVYLCKTAHVEGLCSIVQTSCKFKRTRN